MKVLVGLVGWPIADISGYPSAAGRAQDKESSPAKDRRSTTAAQPTETRNLLDLHKNSTTILPH